jgi:hypothetical protein
MERPIEINANEIDPKAKAESMATSILALTGGKESELINRANLLEMGTENMQKMVVAFIYYGDELENRTPLAKFEEYAKQIAKGEEPGPVVNLTTEAKMMKLVSAEALADTILQLSGIQGRPGFGLGKEDQRAEYPDFNKATLLKLGKDGMIKMLSAFVKSGGSDNRTPIAKFEKYMKQIEREEEPGQQPNDYGQNGPNGPQ